MSSEKHWTPPNRGVTSEVTSLSHGQFPTMPNSSGATFVRPSGKSVAKPGSGKSGPATGGNVRRGQKQLHPDSQAYGPCGVVQVYRSYNNAVTATGRQVRSMPSAFGPQDQFRGGSADGR